MANNSKAPALDVLIRAKDAYEMVQKMKLKPTDKKMMEKKAVLALKQAYQNYLKADDVWRNNKGTDASVVFKPVHEYQDAYNNLENVRAGATAGYPKISTSTLTTPNQVRSQFEQQEGKGGGLYGLGGITKDTILPVGIGRNVKFPDDTPRKNVESLLQYNINRAAYQPMINAYAAGDTEKGDALFDMRERAYKRIHDLRRYNTPYSSK